MTDEGLARRTAALADSSALRAATDKKRKAALDRMVKKNEAISVSAVAREAGVSRPTIRRRKDILARIQKLATAPTPVTLAVPDNLNGESAVVSALRRHVREQADAHRSETAALRAEIQRLKRHSPRHWENT